MTAGFLLILLLAQPVVAQTQAGEEPQEPGPSIEALLEAGQRRIAKLSTLAPGTERVSYFEIHMGPNNAIGYVTATLKAAQAEGGTTYEYSSDTVMRSLTGAQIRAQMKARLTPAFEPLMVEMARGNLLPSGEKKFAVVRAEFAEGTVTVTTDHGAGPTSTQHPRPKPPVIFAVEMLVQQLDINDQEPFALREYSANAAEAGVLKFKRDTWKDGTPTWVTVYETGAVGYQFWYDADEKLLRWTHLTMPVLFIRSTAEEVEKLRAKMGQPLEIQIGSAAAAPGSADGVKTKP